MFTTTDELLAVFKFDGIGMAFRNTDAADRVLAKFSTLPPEHRLNFARFVAANWQEHGADLSADVLIVKAESFPPALPSGCIIALNGFIKRHGEQPGAPSLDADGFPNDPAAAMEVIARAARC